MQQSNLPHKGYEGVCVPSINLIWTHTRPIYFTDDDDVDHQNQAKRVTKHPQKMSSENEKKLCWQLLAMIKIK